MIVVTKFSADGCPKCRMLAPMIKKLAGEFSGDAVFLDCDIDAYPNQAKQHGILSVPVIMIEQNGKEVDRIEGIIPEPVLRQRISDAIETERRTWK